MATRRATAIGAATLVLVVAGSLLRGCATYPAPEEQADVPDVASPYVLSVPDHFHFLQKDPAWARAKMGSSPGTIADYGCTLTSVTMAAANLGVETNPGQLNAALSAVDGYTPRGWLKWNALEEVTGGALKVTVHGAPDGLQVDRCLEDGHYPIVKFKLDDRVQHWALVVAKTADDWAVRDPLDYSRTVRPLGDLTTLGVESVRCIRPGTGS